MRKIFLVLSFFILATTFSYGQRLKSFDFSREYPLQNDKPTVVYFTGTCSPVAMDKLAHITDSLKSQDAYNFYVVLELSVFEKILPLIAAHKYSDSLFKLLDLKYYKHPDRVIKMNLQANAFKELDDEVNAVYHMEKRKEREWEGAALIFTKNNIFLTGANYDVAELVKLVKIKLKDFAPRLQ